MTCHNKWINLRPPLIVHSERFIRIKTPTILQQPYHHIENNVLLLVLNFNNILWFRMNCIIKYSYWILQICGTNVIDSQKKILLAKTDQIVQHSIWKCRCISLEIMTCLKIEIELFDNTALIAHRTQSFIVLQYITITCQEYECELLYVYCNEKTDYIFIILQK